LLVRRTSGTARPPQAIRIALQRESIDFSSSDAHADAGVARDILPAD
jgi:hypothetical protein